MKKIAAALFALVLAACDSSAPPQTNVSGTVGIGTGGTFGQVNINVTNGSTSAGGAVGGCPGGRYRCSIYH